jgi:hypothetical protein
LTKDDRLEWARRCVEAIASRQAKNIAQFRNDSKCPIPLQPLYQYVQSFRETGTIPYHSSGSGGGKPALGKAFEDKVYEAIMNNASRGEKITNNMIRYESNRLALIKAPGESKADIDRRVAICANSNWIRNWRDRYHVVCDHSNSANSKYVAKVMEIKSRVSQSASMPDTYNTTTTTTTTTTTSRSTTMSQSASASSSYSSTTTTTSSNGSVSDSMRSGKLTKADRLRWAKMCNEAITKRSIPMAQFRRDTKCPISIPTLHKYMQMLPAEDAPKMRQTSAVALLATAALDDHFEEQLYDIVMRKTAQGEPISTFLIAREAISLARQMDDGKAANDAESRISRCTRRSWIIDWQVRYNVNPDTASKPIANGANNHNNSNNRRAASFRRSSSSRYGDDNDDSSTDEDRSYDSYSTDDTEHDSMTVSDDDQSAYSDY